MNLWLWEIHLLLFSWHFIQNQAYISLHTFRYNFMNWHNCQLRELSSLFKSKWIIFWALLSLYIYIYMKWNMNIIIGSVLRYKCDRWPSWCWTDAFQPKCACVSLIKQNISKKCEIGLVYSFLKCFAILKCFQLLETIFV